MTCITQQLRTDFNKVIAHSQGLSEVKTDIFLDRWYEAKKDIIREWGGELIVKTKTPVLFTLDEDERCRRLDGFINTIYEHFGNEDLAEFLENVRNDFFDNHLSHEYNDGYITIPKGTKIIKAFKYFEDNETLLSDIQNQASMIIQETKISGTLCLSVHPLDYLSLSENTYRWRSCHALDGAYRAGNLSYLLDRSTIIAYLEVNDTKHKLPNFPEDVLWNSKKWRMLLFLEDERDALFAGRQYPFFSQSALHCVSQLFLDSFHRHPAHWSSWYNDYIIDFPRATCYNSSDRVLYNGRHVALNGSVYAMNDLVVDAKYSRHFNDLLYSSCYIPYYCWTYYPKSDKRRLKFSIGSAVPCVVCNEDHVGDTDDGTMICLDCDEVCGSGENENFMYCACCERRTNRYNLRWMSAIDAYICDDCYETETRHCDECGEFWYECDIQFDRETEKYICPWCRERHKRRNMVVNDDDWMMLPF